MADFPFGVTRQRYGTRFVPKSGVAFHQSRSGTESSRDLYEGREAGQFRIVLQHLSAVELASLISHFEAHYDLEFNYTEPDSGDTFLCMYGDPGLTYQLVGDDMHQANVVLERHKRVITTEYLLQRNGDFLLQRNGDKILRRRS